MKKIKIIAILAVGFAALWSPVAMAWGPDDRPTYTMEVPAPHATFNSITNNPYLGDERDFVRIAEDNGTYANEVKLEDGKIYMVYIAYHNDAASSTNETGAGISKDTKVMTSFPKQIAAGEQKMISALIASSTADPQEVWDEAYVTADEDLKIEYVAGSATVHNDWALDGAKLPDTIFSETGALLGVDQADGTVLGCAEYSGYVIYRIKAYKESTPPETPPEEETPPTPSELPKTGPAEIVMATAVVLGICGGCFYLYRTKRALKRVTDSVMNEPMSGSSKTDDEKHDSAD